MTQVFLNVYDVVRGALVLWKLVCDDLGALLDLGVCGGPGIHVWRMHACVTQAAAYMLSGAQVSTGNESINSVVLRINNIGR